MRTPTMNKTLIALSLCMILAPVTRVAVAEEEGGKRVDNARVDIHAVPAPGEVQPDFAYPMPSGVSHGDAMVMRAAAGRLPITQAQVKETLSDALGNGSFFSSGSADLTATARQVLSAFTAPYKGKANLRLSVVGHTDSQQLSPRSKKIFRDNQVLSEARALAVADFLRKELGMPAADATMSGKGDSAPIASNATPEGMAENRRVEVQIWHDVIAAPEPVAVQAPVVRAPCIPMAEDQVDVPFRVTVDGEPVDLDTKPREADRQRCTDVALEKADIQVRFDNLAIAPAMNIWATPNGVLRGEKVEFLAWSNYIPWVKKAELRLFRTGQKVQETPLAVLPVDWNGVTEWNVPADAQDDQLFYLLRVTDADGVFDETSLKPLTLLAYPKPLGDEQRIERERLAGYGENSLVLRNIPVSGGTVTVNGRALKSGQRVETLGQVVPVDADGKFAIKQIMPAGAHTVEVKVGNTDGTATTFRRNLSIAKDDWFYIALGDLTVGKNSVAGPAALVTNDTQHYDQKVYMDGRAAFYLKGKIKGEYLLTMAADTREQPLGDLFTNFSSKDPRYLLRNINPDLYYPVYGDDSTVVDDAPTQGKFYVKLEKGDSHVMWGNFQTSWSGTELLQYSRGLYGAKLRYRSDETTSYGEKRTQADAFAADPGTIASREEFRGTGGSLYYLHHMDITQGSERVWVEVRDKDSGLVIERKQLTPAQDYEINYLQGRILLQSPLSSVSGGGGLVMTSAANGNPLYLVSTYEYVPGVAEVSNLSTGVRASQWMNDYLQLGFTGYHQGESGADQTLKGVDATLRYKPGTYLKIEGARSSGNGNGAQTSIDGGFGFNQLASSGGDANAHRVEAAVDLAEVTDGGKGKITAYTQDRQRGFSAPGQIMANGEAVNQSGAKVEMQVAENTRVEAKADVRNSDIQDAKNLELAVHQKLDAEWELSAGIRRDERQNEAANASTELSQNGERTDAIVRADYKPEKEGGNPGEKEDWEAYGFAQGTLSRDGTREENDRVGAGGAWRINDRVKLLAELSDGSLGTGGKVGVDYRLSDRSNAYLNYVVESENPDWAYRGRQGTFVSGASSRVSDSTRVFGETRASQGAGPQSLSNAFGLDWSPNDRWTWGGKAEVGKISDTLGGDLNRHALGLSTGYKEGNLKYTGGVEWREDAGTIGGADVGTRVTWLLRNTLGWQYTKEWRLLGKLNISRSSNSQGAFYDGNYHEIVAGAAYRPVGNDRWNTLFKYTNFYNVPSPGQLGGSGAVADYAQKSQVFAVDTIYDLRPWLSVGGKYALRIGELKASKAAGDWFYSRADLLILRGDLHFVKEWDAVLEVRDLNAREAQDARAGALIGVYRHVAEGVKVGVGYNFTNYSDDLTDLSYRSRGWFLNILGTM